MAGIYSKCVCGSSAFFPAIRVSRVLVHSDGQVQTVAVAAAITSSSHAPCLVTPESSPFPSVISRTRTLTLGDDATPAELMVPAASQSGTRAFSLPSPPCDEGGEEGDPAGTRLRCSMSCISSGRMERGEPGTRRRHIGQLALVISHCDKQAACPWCMQHSTSRQSDGSYSQRQIMHAMASLVDSGMLLMHSSKLMERRRFKRSTCIGAGVEGLAAAQVVK